MFSARVLRWQVAAILFTGVALLGGCPETQEPEDQTPEPNVIPDTTPVNEPPVADAGDDQTASAGGLVVLDGDGSSDADGDRLAFFWRQTDGDLDIVLEDGFSSRPRFFVPDVLTQETVLTFRLTVIDGFAVDFDEVSVTVRP
jgi:hypothetical protein